MGRLIYFELASLDGYIEDAEGSFQFSRPGEDVFECATEVTRPIGTALYGRRMYEVMLFWETAPTDDSVTPIEREFTELWRSQEKIVFSRTLTSVSSGKTRIEREFSPELVNRLKQSSPRDIAISGAELAGQALKAGLIDELQVMVVPRIVGGGKSWLPKSVNVELELLEARKFPSGFVFLRYRPKTTANS